MTQRWYASAVGLAVCALGALAGEPVPAPPPTGATIKVDKSKPLPAAPGYHVMKGTATYEGKEFPIAWGLFLPSSYFAGNQPFPLICTLHNVVSDVGGSDGNPALVSEGFGLLMVKDIGSDSRHSGVMPKNPVNPRKTVLFIGLAPQYPKDMGFERAPMNKVVVELINEIGRLYRMDQDKVFLTGFSYGGTCTWHVACDAPDRFAGIIPLSARLAPNPEQAPEILKKVGVWQGVGDQDGGFFDSCQQMNDHFKKANHPNHTYMVIKGGAHHCYQAVYGDPKLWEWFLAQHRPLKAKPPAAAPPPPAAVAVAVDERPAHRAALVERLAPVAGKRREKARLKVFGAKQEVAITGGDAAGLTVEWGKNSLPMRWKDLEEEDLARLALLYCADDAEALYHAAALAGIVRAEGLFTEILTRLRQLNTDQAREKIAALAGKK